MAACSVEYSSTTVLQEVLVAFPKYLVTLSELSLKFMRRVMSDEGGLYMMWLRRCETSRNWRKTALQAVLQEHDAGFALELHSQSVNRRDINGVYHFQVIGRVHM